MLGLTLALQVLGIGLRRFLQAHAALRLALYHFQYSVLRFDPDCDD